MAKTPGDSELWLPYDFPYEFGVSSPVSSTETESSDEEEDFLAALTQRLAHTTLLHHTTTHKHSQLTKTRDFAGSPQSTLTGMGGSGDGSPNSHSHVSSDPWEVIYAAAGQVARIKLNAQLSHLHFHNKPPSFSNNQYEVEKQECGSVWGRQGILKPNWLAQQQQLLQLQNRARELGYEDGKCNRIMQLQHQNQRVHFGGSGSRSRVVLPGGSSVKRGCAGTGVFLPRHYETAPSDSRHKNDSAPVMLPSKPVYGLKSNIHDLNATSQPRFSNMDYEMLLARRNALIMQQQSLIARREEAANCEIRLPQEWTY